MTKLKEIVIGYPGTLRIYFEMYSSSGVSTVYGRIYRNGGAVGTTRSTQSTSPVPYTEDEAGWSVGDLVQIYARSAGVGYTVYIKNFRIKVSVESLAVVNGYVVNLD